MQNAQREPAHSIHEISRKPVEKSMLRGVGKRLKLGAFIVVCTFGSTYVYMSHFKRENAPPPQIFLMRESTIPILTLQDPTKEGWKESSQESHTVLGLKITIGFIGARAPFLVKWYRSGINNDSVPNSLNNSVVVGSKDNPSECSISPCLVENIFHLGQPNYPPKKENYSVTILDSDGHVSDFEIQKVFRDSSSLPTK